MTEDQQSSEEESARIAADLAYQRLKDTGELWRMEAHRALVDQLKHQEQS